MPRRKITPTEKRFGRQLAQLRLARALTQADVANHFKIKVQAVSAWERGAARPDVDKLTGLSDLYGVNVEDMLSQPGKGRRPRGAVPVVSAVQAGQWTPAADPFPVGRGDRTVTCDSAVSEGAYALDVKGRSMLPRFREGDVVIIEPRTMLDPAPKDFVVVKLDGDDEVTFKQFWRNRGNAVEIRALNEEEFEPVVLGQDIPGRIIGVMIEHHSYRRK